MDDDGDDDNSAIEDRLAKDMASVDADDYLDHLGNGGTINNYPRITINWATHTNSATSDTTGRRPAAATSNSATQARPPQWTSPATSQCPRTATDEGISLFSCSRAADGITTAHRSGDPVRPYEAWDPAPSRPDRGACLPRRLALGSGGRASRRKDRHSFSLSSWSVPR